MAMLDKATYLASLQADIAAIPAASADGLRRSVPACPGWTLADLVGHVATVYRFAGAVARERPQDAEAVRPIRERLQRERSDHPEAGDPMQALNQAAAALLEALEGLGPDDPIWSWSPRLQRGIFWHRRMAQETLIHRWDAQQAAGAPGPIASELALDGIGETFDTLVPFRR